MKVAFIHPNSHNAQLPRPPLGLLSVATVCQHAGHEVRLIDANALKLEAEDVATMCQDYDVIGLTALTPTIGEAVKIADALADKTIILGGVHASTFPEDCADTGIFDCVVIGEGETVILGALMLDYDNNPRINCEILAGQHVKANDIPIPDYSLLDLSLYHANPPHKRRDPWTIASTSRGCHFHCAFCVKCISGDDYRAMDSERMFKLVEYLQKDFGIRDITFYDDLFTKEMGRVWGFCNHLIKSRADLSWTCESRVNFANFAMLEKMHAAGCRLIYYGIESGNQRILNNLKKGQTLEMVQEAIENTQRAGIQAAGYFMLGCPGESPETILDTLEFARDLGLDHAQFSICSPLPGSALYEQYVQMGYPVPAWSEFRYLGGNGLKPMFTTSELSREYLELVVAKANEQFTVKA